MREKPQATMPPPVRSLQEGQLPEVGLTAREREVLRHLAEGCTYASAARRMQISRHTVDAHARRIKRKYGVRSWMEILNTLVDSPTVQRPARSHSTIN
ncbi:hypothetical protein Asp14428_17010 [Actinoplanes sp. NBRC 14428]|uniref:Regulatory LuxR family protein n=1 Tax=Pseudosporangium ferrugineum TaxID=439699 RepID=A0A2T0SBC6_9ACTN|nr:helix-turn-helix transcriptional regulator [Pseudosporangium ferrugineum]PRY30681.1 regulatory LuxR family protein [Pseudosporangium ferrugineum]BCJ50226.1 hypothetical protein Asp14428_17010 [Actinoplanes sp. NBRC 14428]